MSVQMGFEDVGVGHKRTGISSRVSAPTKRNLPWTCIPISIRQGRC